MKQTVTSRTLLFSVLLALTVSAAACGTKETSGVNSDPVTSAGSGNQAEASGSTNAGTNGTDTTSSSDTDAGAKPDNAGQSSEGTGKEDAPTMEQATIKAYFSDEDLLNLLEQERLISYPAHDVKAKLTAAYQSLQADGTNKEVSLWKSIELLSLSVNGNAVTLDFHIPDEARLGGPGESMALDALKKTMFQFDEVGSIDVLVDGEQVESLMGHDELEHPIVKP